MELTAAMQNQAKALADPSRFRLFQFISEAAEPVRVAELTELLGFNHNAIRQHLAILVESELIVESTEERTVRGRPRKQYELRNDALHAFSPISGAYERLANMLLDVASTNDTAFDVGYRTADTSVATEDGSAENQKPLPSLVRQLAVDGFEPRELSEGVIELQNCPFADVASKNPGVVCELHRGLISGQLAARGSTATSSLTAHEPHTAGCIVDVRDADTSP